VTSSSKRSAGAAIVAIAAFVMGACGSSDSSEEAAETATAETAEATETSEGAAATEPPATTAGEEPATTEGADATTAPPDAGGATELATGEVFITGSSTVSPISERVSELADELSGGELLATVEGPGTGDGFEIFCGGEADVTGASRPIRDEEMQACADSGVEYVELKIGIDGLTVATSPNNTAVECLDTAALYALLGPESEGFASWSDANVLAAELGSAYSTLPEAPLAISGPGPESGTYDSFVEFAIADFAEERGQDEATRFDYTTSANDNLIVGGIEGSDTSLGWIGFAYYQAEGERMKAISIVNPDTGECVAPTDESVADGTYPFSRDLFIYVNVANAQSNPAVASFVDLYLSDDGIASVADAGYVNEGADDLAAARDAWASAIGG
jgi:phosphate transport system substrate-binding protein